MGANYYDVCINGRSRYCFLSEHTATWVKNTVYDRVHEWHWILNNRCLSHTEADVLHWSEKVAHVEEMFLYVYGIPIQDFKECTILMRLDTQQETW